MISILHPKKRSGVIQVEVVVAGVLLFALISIVPTLGYHLSRIQKESQQYQIAVQTLANELDRLRMVEAQDASKALADLQLPDYVAERLPNATIQALSIDDEWGLRVKLSLQWERVGDPPPVEMVAWLDTNPRTAGKGESR